MKSSLHHFWNAKYQFIRTYQSLQVWRFWWIASKKVHNLDFESTEIHQKQEYYSLRSQTWKYSLKKIRQAINQNHWFWIILLWKRKDVSVHSKQVLPSPRSNLRNRLLNCNRYVEPWLHRIRALQRPAFIRRWRWKSTDDVYHGSHRAASKHALQTLSTQRSFF